MFKELSRNAKKELVKKYENTQKGKKLSDTLNRLLIEGIFCLICFIIILIAILVADLAWWYCFFAGLTLICGLIFVIGQYLIRNREYNRFFKQLSNSEKNKLTKCK